MRNLPRGSRSRPKHGWALTRLKARAGQYTATGEATIYRSQIEASGTLDLGMTTFFQTSLFRDSLALITG